jgi:AraC-like DNA-binding protein
MNSNEALCLSQSAVAEVPHRLRLTTRGLRKRDRFEVFRENFSRYLYPACVENSSEGTFDGGIDLVRAGSVGISRIVAPASTYTRTRRHIADSDDALTLFVGLAHGPAIEQAGVAHEFRPGSGFLYHGAIPGECEAASQFSVWGIKVAADRIRSGLARDDRLKPMGIPAELPVMKLTTQYLDSFTGAAANLDADACDTFGTHIVDLLTLIIGAGRDTLELIKGRGLKAARTEAVLKAISREFASPNISAEKIGATLGVSGRQVHRLLEDTTKTFYEHVLERRLIEARQLLTKPSCDALKVADIARRAGFVDPSYFNRVFRVRFGDTPTGVREDAARARSARS